MKTNIRPNTKTAGFSMIEMIGVLAVIAILAALLIPKVFDAINSAKINGTAAGLNTVKTAVVTHFGKYGALNLYNNGVSNNAAITDFTAGAAPAAGYDLNVLLLEKLLDKPFETKIGTAGSIDLVKVDTATTVSDGNLGKAFWLSGQGATANANECSPGSVIVRAKIDGVALSDAEELNNRIDGPGLGAVSVTTTGEKPVTTKNDYRGRVTYSQPATAGDPVTVYVYLESK